MARSEWIAISEARDALATRFYDHVAGDWLVAYQASWLAILGSLIDGELPSVSESPNDFKWLLVNASGDVVKSMSLESELIPTDFWWHHREASKAYPIDIVLQSGDGAHSSGDDFWFEQSCGLGDGLIMRGHVQNVQVHLYQDLWDLTRWGFRKSP